MTNKTYKWTVEIEVSENWVVDGFNPSANDFHAAIYGGMLGYAYPEEVKVRTIKAPAPEAIDAAHW